VNPTDPAAGTAAPAPAAPPVPRATLDAIFRPRSVAVIGASRDRRTVGGAIFHNLVSHDFRGPVYPVNPKASVVQSVRAYPTIREIPDPVDLAVVVVPAAQVLEVVEACGEKGVRGVVVISAGFKETGGAGQEREAALLECVRRRGMRLIGPNCLGVLNTEAGVCLDATFAPIYPPAGRVAFSSQSGALGLAILDLAAELSIGISHFASVGNKAEVSGNDLLEYWEADPGTGVILLYLESFGNPRRFLEIARRVGRVKPIAAVKSGRTRAGMRAASSHTGSLAGADTAVEALCAQSGVIRCDTIEELFDVAMPLATQPLPAGRRVGILTNAGGPGIMASDACETHGLEVATLAEETVRALRQFLPPEASTRNPVDMIASAVPESYEKSLRLLAADPNVDALLVLYVPPIVTTPLEVARAIVRGNEAAKADGQARGRPPKPVLSCFLGSHGVLEGLRSLHEGHIPSYAFPESAAIALSRLARHAAWRSEPDGLVRRFDDVRRGEAAEVLARASARAGSDKAWLEASEVAVLLDAYRLPRPGERFAASADAAAEAARALGFPVALKLVSPTITHKSEVGGVVLNLADERTVREAFAGIERRLAGLGRRAEMSGVLVQAMILEGVETIVGMTRDPSFGPLLMFGMGGVQVELLQDVIFRVHPLTDRDAHAMVSGVRGSRLLSGYRGAPPGDVAALEATLSRLSQLAGDHPEIVEMDLNPLKVLEPGRGCVVLDARVAVRKP
jgi:acetyl coenzyme A synthetase (ADP forming)-like protein